MRILFSPNGVRGGRAMTLPEVLVSMAIFTLVIGSVMSSHVFGLRLYQVTKTKLGTTDSGRHTLSRMIDEIRSALLVKVGTGDQVQFAEAATDQPQSGNAVQIYTGTNATNWIRYYLDTNDNILKRAEPGGNLSAVVAGAVTNRVVFSAEDFLGTVLTNHVNNRVIGLTMKFSQLVFRTGRTPTATDFDYYQLRTKITRRRLQ